jgi:hypothetical protein
LILFHALFLSNKSRFITHLLHTIPTLRRVSIKMQPNMIMPRPIAQGMIRRPRPKRTNLPKSMLPKRIGISNHTGILSIMCTIDALAGNVLAATAYVDATLAGSDVIGSEVDAVIGG